MNFNKCARCGCFYITDGAVCPSCTPKDKNDISKLKTFFDDNTAQVTVNELSAATGISQKNLSRYISEKGFEYKKQIKL
ncbi:MAG: hypothetical protein IJH12_00780 [Clostridia bacterium]|nr:hypothetical protein [Clostridia bacterium]